MQVDVVDPLPYITEVAGSLAAALRFYSYKPGFHKGVQDEFYPCKPDIFAATYEAVEP